MHLAVYLERRGSGLLMTSPADLKLDGAQVAQPDIFVLPGSRHPSTWETAPIPPLAIEVLSASTACFDRAFKHRYYQRAGVAEFWVVDADAQVVERWRPSDERPEVIDLELAWQPAPEVAPLVIDLPVMFARLDPE